MAFSLLLLLALVLLVFTGLGVFRLYFDFDWTAGEGDSSQLFSLRVLGGSAFNLFEAEPFGAWFWTIRAVTAALLLALPWFRPLGSLMLGIVAALSILSMHHLAGVQSRIAIEFELLTIAAIFLLHLGLSLYAEVRVRQEITRVLRQYVPFTLAGSWHRGTERSGPCNEQREVSVMFCDIVNFSERSVDLEPAALAHWLNGFFELVSGIVVKHGGSIDKYIGDSVMAIWGAPEPSDHHARQAVAAAVDIQQGIAALSSRFERDGRPSISAGIGIGTGVVNVGTLGSTHRRDYTVVGDTVNVARRLESHTRLCDVSILVSDQTVAAVPERTFEVVDSIQVKGHRQPLSIHTPSDPAPSE